MKNKSLIISVFLFAVLLVTACSITSIVGLEFIETPDEIVYSTEAGKVNAKIRIIYSDGKNVEVDLDNVAKYGIKVTGRDYAQGFEGTKTLTVSFGAISASFEYTVYKDEDGWKDQLFAGGEGSVNDPYLISNAVQLSNIRYALEDHFKLTKNIDLTEIKWQPIGETIVTYANGLIYVTPIESFSGTLDGNNHTIKMKATKEDKISTSDSNLDTFALFDYIQGVSRDNPAKIKNLTMDMDIEVQAKTAGLAGTASFVEIENVTITGSMTGYGVAGFINATEYGVKFTNCVNKANITIINERLYFPTGGVSVEGWTFAGGFIAQAVGDIEFINSHNEGNIEKYIYNDELEYYSAPDNTVTGAVRNGVAFWRNGDTRYSGFVIAGQFIGQLNVYNKVYDHIQPATITFTNSDNSTGNGPSEVPHTWNGVTASPNVYNTSNFKIIDLPMDYIGRIYFNSGILGTADHENMTIAETILDAQAKVDHNSTIHPNANILTDQYDQTYAVVVIIDGVKLNNRTN